MVGPTLAPPRLLETLDFSNSQKWRVSPQTMILWNSENFLVSPQTRAPCLRWEFRMSVIREKSRFQESAAGGVWVSMHTTLGRGPCQSVPPPPTVWAPPPPAAPGWGPCQSVPPGWAPPPHRTEWWAPPSPRPDSWKRWISRILRIPEFHLKQ